MRILITGANRGLGLEFTRQYLARGERVIATARHPAKAGALNHLAGEYPGHLTVLPLDVTVPGSIDELVRELKLVSPALDLVIANAGAMVRGERFGELMVADLERAWRVNTLGPLILAQSLAPALRLGAQPRLVFISSILASIAARDSFYVPSYCISKAGLNMVMRQCAHALAEDGVINIALHPGWVRTDMGGAQAPLTPEQSVSDMLSVIDGLKSGDNGRFYAHDGSELPW